MAVTSHILRQVENLDDEDAYSVQSQEGRHDRHCAEAHLRQLLFFYRLDVCRCFTEVELSEAESLEFLFEVTVNA